MGPVYRRFHTSRLDRFREGILKSIEVENFKSLRKAKVDFGGFNVFVGCNGSGKSNILDIFEFLKKVVDPAVINPFIGYGGYNNVVWMGDEKLPIKITLTWNVNGSNKGNGEKLSYSITISGFRGTFRIVNEFIQLGSTTILSDGNEIVFKKDSSEFHASWSKNERIFYNKSILSSVSPSIIRRMISKKGDVDRREYFSTLIDLREITDVIEVLINKASVHNLIPRDMKKPATVQSSHQLLYNGENISAFLYTLFSENEGWPPEIIDRLKIIFPDLEKISSTPTEDGRISLSISERGCVLLPQSVSDGFFKVLAILALSFYKGRVIIIDEIENSLHPEAIELILDALRDSKNQVVLTTHSPIVLNIVNLEDIHIVSKKGGETEVHHVENPKELKKKLDEEGISFGEGWLLKVLE